jgi:hypothetical protein
MKRVNVFLALLVTSIAALIGLTAIGFAIFTSAQTNQHNSDWMGQMWGMGGGMMGINRAPQSASSQLLPYLGWCCSHGEHHHNWSNWLGLLFVISPNQIWRCKRTHDTDHY